MVAVVACMLVIAGGVGYWFFQSGKARSPGVPVIVGNGLTFSQAWDPVNASLSGVPGGPWRLTSILGIATEVPESPVPTFGQYVGLNSTMKVCGNLTGVTVWNSSAIPVFTGSLNSGGAPYWSFVLKNSSAAFLYATSILGVARIYSAAVSTPCIVAAGGSGWGYLNRSITQDSPLISGLAYSAAGENFTVRHSPVAEYYVLGGSQLIDPDASPFGWVVNYFRCDLVGVSGLQDYSAVGILASGNQTATFVDNGWLTCTNSNYTLDFASFPLNMTPQGTNGTFLALPFQVTFPLPQGNTTTTFYDGARLQAWMSRLQLDSSGGTPLTPSVATCQQWVPSLSNCPGSSDGWFAVLLSADGLWLDSFPSAQNATNWSIPNVLVTSHDRIVVVLPSVSNGSGDTLTALGTSSTVQVNGIATL